MITSDAPDFGRVLTAMVTPFGDDGKIDYGSLQKLIEHLIATGTTAIVVNGTTGESPTLDDSEKEDLLKAVVAQVSGRVRIIMGTGSNITAKSIKATAIAQSLGAEAALVVCPYYNKPSQAGLLAHFGAIAESTTLPIFIYNIPGRTGINMTVDTTVQLSHKYKNIYALKDSTGNVEQASDIAAAARPDFRIYSGDDNMTVPFLSVGACGVISVASHVVGKQIADMIDASLRGDVDNARQAHYHLMPVFKGLFAAPNPTCVKYALSRLGLCKEHLRLPLVPLDENQKQAVDKLISIFDKVQACAK